LHANNYFQWIVVSISYSLSGIPDFPFVFTCGMLSFVLFIAIKIIRGSPSAYRFGAASDATQFVIVGVLFFVIQILLTVVIIPPNHRYLNQAYVFFPGMLCALLIEQAAGLRLIKQTRYTS
jgi:hypothetical protein